MDKNQLADQSIQEIKADIERLEMQIRRDDKVLLTAAGIVSFLIILLMIFFL